MIQQPKSSSEYGIGSDLVVVVVEICYRDRDALSWRAPLLRQSSTAVATPQVACDRRTLHQILALDILTCE